MHTNIPCEHNRISTQQCERRRLNQPLFYVITYTYHSPAGDELLRGIRTGLSAYFPTTTRSRASCIQSSLSGAKLQLSRRIEFVVPGVPAQQVASAFRVREGGRPVNGCVTHARTDRIVVERFSCGVCSRVAGYRTCFLLGCKKRKKAG